MSSRNWPLGKHVAKISTTSDNPVDSVTFNDISSSLKIYLEHQIQARGLQNRSPLPKNCDFDRVSLYVDYNLRSKFNNTSPDAI